MVDVREVSQLFLLNIIPPIILFCLSYILFITSGTTTIARLRGEEGLNAIRSWLKRKIPSTGQSSTCTRPRPVLGFDDLLSILLF